MVGGGGDNAIGRVGKWLMPENPGSQRPDKETSKMSMSEAAFRIRRTLAPEGSTSSFTNTCKTNREVIKSNWRGSGGRA